MDNDEKKVPQKKQSLLAPFIKGALEDIHPSWMRILLSVKLKPVFDKMLKSIDSDLYEKGISAKCIAKNGINTYLRPRVKNIFEAFKMFDANNTKVILIGQDPYPDADCACGLSFSVPDDVKIPASLSNMYECLVKSKLVKEKPKTGNLTGWAKQGILLLNASLTRTPLIVNTVYYDEVKKRDVSKSWINGNGGSNNECMHHFWLEYTEEFLKYMTEIYIPTIMNHSDHTVFVLLLGKDAQTLEKFVCTKPEKNPRNNKVVVMKYGHPSPLNPQNRGDNPANFLNCPHFAEISKKSGINWDPLIEVEDHKDQFLLLRKKAKSMNGELGKLFATDDPKLVYNDKTTTIENRKIKRFIENKILVSKGLPPKEDIIIEELDTRSAPSETEKAEKEEKEPEKEEKEPEKEEKEPEKEEKEPEKEPEKEEKEENKKQKEKEENKKQKEKEENKEQKEKEEQKEHKEQKKQKGITIKVFVDGACPGNGRETANASYGVYFPKQEYLISIKKSECENGLGLCGIIPKTMLSYSQETKEIKMTTKPQKPTNNRGELLALIMAVRFICKNWVAEINKIDIIMDSTYVRAALNKNAYSIISDKKKLVQKPNYDLIVLLYKYLHVLSNKIKVCPSNELHKFLIGGGILEPHCVNSHLTQNAKDKLGGEELEFCEGNEIADKLCNFAIKNGTKFGEELSADAIK